MSCSYVSLLTTDDYVDGLLVLVHSLRETKSSYDCHVLLTSDISPRIHSILAKHGIAYTIVSSISNPTDVNMAHRWFRTYSKIHVFGLTQYEKVVYLDADMLILENIDTLFERPHMSATDAGSMLPSTSHWTHMNSGLFVATPSALLFDDMLSRAGKIEPLASGGTADRPRCGSDQDFINAYYPAWRQQADLHLDHKYNMLHYHMDAYNRYHGYTLVPGPKRVAVLHYASYLKPWTQGRDAIAKLPVVGGSALEASSLQLWSDAYDRMCNNPNSSSEWQS
ncbi:MAG: hypothetical protein JW384_01362 [Nitrosomonadaceae bacterium]|nr:hypothetical protein [Nitrosomonadaceae bacterium]